MGETITIHDALLATVNLLGNIPVPRNLNMTIGIPIDNAISNLRACIEAIEKNKEGQDGNDNAE